MKFHLSNVYRKLEVGNRTEASHYAHRVFGDAARYEGARHLGRALDGPAFAIEHIDAPSTVDLARRPARVATTEAPELDECPATNGAINGRSAKSDVARRCGSVHRPVDDQARTRPPGALGARLSARPRVRLPDTGPVGRRGAACRPCTRG